MKVIIDRNLCDASLPFCARCSAALIRHPEGVDRPCIMDIIDEENESLTIVLQTDERTVEIDLDEEAREIGSVEGWEALADFDPALFRVGAIDRWREIRKLPADH